MKSAFVHTGGPEHSVYVIPPRESSNRLCYFLLLLTASHGLVKADAKFQMMYDNLLLDLGSLRVIDIPQLFQRMIEGQIAILMAKIVDNILIRGQTSAVDQLLKAFNAIFKFGTAVHGPRKPRNCSFNIVQNKYFTCMIE